QITYPTIFPKRLKIISRSSSFVTGFNLQTNKTFSGGAISASGSFIFEMHTRDEELGAQHVVPTIYHGQQTYTTMFDLWHLFGLIVTGFLTQYNSIYALSTLSSASGITGLCNEVGLH
ncbi:hypothetical protein ALC53_10166, partial [Atta colombica]